MPDFYRIASQDVRGQFLTCLVTELSRHDACLEPSPSLAFGFLWDALRYDDESSPLARVVAGYDFFSDHAWTAATAEQIISCVGLLDHRFMVIGEFSHMMPGQEGACATFNIAVTDPRWLEHITTSLESGNSEWESRVRCETAAPVFDPTWRTPAVLALARRIADEQDFDALPSLADALQAVGCNEESVLNHCRGPGPHVNGCWALDLVLGRWWLTNEDPEIMLRGFGTEVSERKLRLFACACCRRVEGWAELADREGRGDDYRNAVAVAERFADGAATAAELRAAHDRADGNVLDRTDDWCHGDPFEDVTGATIGQATLAAERIRDMFFSLEPPTTDGPEPSPALLKARRERLAQAALLRDLFGNVFRPVTFSPAWRTDTAVALASQMYESRDFSAMPILADALQDAGCDNAEILDHCRGPGPHVRGCWVVDAVIDKE